MKWGGKENGTSVPEMVANKVSAGIDRMAASSLFEPVLRRMAKLEASQTGRQPEGEQKNFPRELLHDVAGIMIRGTNAQSEFGLNNDEMPFFTTQVAFHLARTLPDLHSNPVILNGQTIGMEISAPLKRSLADAFPKNESWEARFTQKTSDLTLHAKALSHLGRSVVLHTLRSLNERREEGYVLGRFISHLENASWEDQEIAQNIADCMKVVPDIDGDTAANKLDIKMLVFQRSASSAK